MERARTVVEITTPASRCRKVATVVGGGKLWGGSWLRRRKVMVLRWLDSCNDAGSRGDGTGDAVRCCQQL